MGKKQTRLSCGCGGSFVLLLPLFLRPKKLVLQWFSISIPHQTISTDERLICSREAFRWIKKHQKFNSPEQLRSLVVVFRWKSLNHLPAPFEGDGRWCHVLALTISEISKFTFSWWAAQLKSFSIACHGALTRFIVARGWPEIFLFSRGWICWLHVQGIGWSRLW